MARTRTRTQTLCVLILHMDLLRSGSDVGDGAWGWGGGCGLDDHRRPANLWSDRMCVRHHLRRGLHGFTHTYTRVYGSSALPFVCVYYEKRTLQHSTARTAHYYMVDTCVECVCVSTCVSPRHARTSVRPRSEHPEVRLHTRSSRTCPVRCAPRVRSLAHTYTLTHPAKTNISAAGLAARRASSVW